MSINVENISKSFSNKKVLSQLFFNPEKMPLHCFLGVNGSGKTTLFNIISGAIVPDVGQVRFNSKNINKYSVYKRSNLGIRRSFQNANVFENMTVKQNINLSIITAIPQIDKHMLQSNVTQVLDDFHISHISQSLAGDISFGQRKLLSLAMAMAVPSKLLLLDEPVAGLQPRYHDILANIIRAHKGVKLVIDHNIDFLRSLNAQSHFISGGRIVTSGLLDEVLSEQSVKDEYL